jgi:pseudolysin
MRQKIRDFCCDPHKSEKGFIMRKIIIVSLYYFVMTSLYASQLQFMKHSSFLEDNLSSSSALVKIGGYGGNKKSGRLSYSQGALPALNVTRDPSSGFCYLKNNNVIIRNYYDESLIKFPCNKPDPEHNNLYWDGELGAVNDGYSPENDALYAGDIVTNTFLEWYGIPPLKDEIGIQVPIRIFLHASLDDVRFLDDGMALGDGRNQYYPLTSLDMISYIIGDIFIRQNAHLNWQSKQTGGINIAFDCITAMASEFYVTGKNTWQLGQSIVKNGLPLHYLDLPSRNCSRDSCDIDTLAQFNTYTTIYEGCGLYNRAFYSLATTPGWDTHRAYNVFVQAGRFHWHQDTDFHSGACDLVTSAKELGYDKMAVMIAFSIVGIDTRDCSKV